MDFPIRRVFEEIGLQTADRAAEDSFVYDGETVALRKVGPTIMPPEELLHEACHWIVATEEERQFPEYGLGSKLSAHLSYDYMNRVEQVLPRFDRKIRECSALALHQKVGNQIGLRWNEKYSLDEFIQQVEKIHLLWKEWANQWFACRGIDVDAVALQMINAYKNLKISAVRL